MTSKTRPLVSIGMPVYNGEKYICEALDSLLAQTFTNFELIISDNASIDDTEIICRGYAKKDQRIRYIRQQTNLGALGNFQFVLEKGCSKYFMWAASDDKWEKGWIEALYSQLTKTGKCAVFGLVQQIDGGGQNVMHLANNRCFQFSGNRLWRRIAFFLQFEGAGKANLFYSLFEKKQLEEIRLAGYRSDYLALFDLLSSTEFVTVNYVHLFKRIHDSNDGAGAEKTATSKLLDAITLKLLGRDIRVAASYLKYTTKGEKFLLTGLVPIKIFIDRKSTRLNSSHSDRSRMPSSA